MKRNIISTIEAVELPEYLKAAILKRIQNETRKRQVRRKMLSTVGFFVSGTGVISSLIFFGREILASDFWSIASLAFSDLGTVAGHWQDFTLSLLETLPVVSIIAVLLPIFITLVLIKQYGKYQENLQLNLNFKQ